MQPNDQEHGDINDQRQSSFSDKLAIGIAIGVALGAGIGVAMDNLAVGIGVGIAIGVAIGVAMADSDKSVDRPGEDTPPTDES